MNFGATHEARLSIDLDELKLIYKVLHRNLTQYPELMDSELFSHMQEVLQQAASLEGVDIGDHAQWASWLEHAVADGSQAFAMSGQLLN